LVWFGQEWFSLSHNQGFKELSAQRCPATTRLDHSKNIKKIGLRILPGVLLFPHLKAFFARSTHLCANVFYSNALGFILLWFLYFA
jgi:hypothetical protein